jgi:hypothetical protein
MRVPSAGADASVTESQQEAQWRLDVLESMTRVRNVLHDMSDIIHASTVLAT